MADGTSIKKAVKKLSSSVDKIKSSGGDDRQTALRDFHVVAEEICETWAPGEISGEDDSVQEIIKALRELKAIDQEAYSAELDHFLTFITNSKDLWHLKIEDYNSEDKYDAILGLLSAEKPIVLDDHILEIIFRAARAVDRYKDAAIFLSKRNKYLEPLFAGLAESDVDENAKTTILNNFQLNHNDDASLAFLELLKKTKNDIWARLRIVEILEKKSRQELLAELETFPFDKIVSLQEYRNMGYLLLRNDLSESLITMDANALKTFPDDYELLKLKAEAFLKLDEKVESYEIFKQLAVRNNSDLGVIKNAISLAFEQRLFEECQNIIESFPDAKKDPAIMAKKIECEIQTSKFTEAVKDLEVAIASHPEDKALLNLKFKALMKLNNESEAFNLARDLMHSDPENDEATNYAMGWLFKRGEFDDIVSLCDQNDFLKKKYLPMYIACQIYEDNYKLALKEINDNPDLLNAPQIVDAVFFNVRNDDFLLKLDEVYGSLKTRLPYYRIVANRLRGIRPRPDSLEDSVITQNSSQAVAYVISYEYYSTKSPIVPDRVRSMLYLPTFKEIRSMMEFLTSIYEGRFTDDVVDSPRYLFPLTEAYTKLGALDKAESQLVRTTHSEADPFYKYSLSLIDFYRGNYVPARKYVESAMATIRNADFVKLLLSISVITGDPKKLREYLDEVLSLRLIDSFDFSELYAQITKNSLWDMASILVGIDAEGTLRNPWILRLKRDLSMRIGDLRKAADSSALLFSTNQYVRADIFKHLEILDRLGKSQDIIHFLLDLETDNKSVWLEEIIGNAYYKMSKFADASKHYSTAISLGAHAEDLPNYIDTLIEVGQFKQSADLVQKTDNRLLQLKLYFKTSNIKGVLDLLGKLSFKQPEEQEIVRFAADNLWYNADIREFLVNLYKQEGYTWLGKIIAVRTFENNEKKLALDIAKNLNKNNPEDLDIVSLYCDLLIKSGEREDAIQLLLQSLKFCTDFPKCMGLTNTLLRLYYDDRDYEAVIKFFETNPKYIDEKSLQYVVRSYMEADNFDYAEKLMSRYEGTLLSKDVHHELREDLKTKKEFMETIFYVSRLLKLEYKLGKKFDKKEAFYKADIPIEQIEPVYQFLSSRDFYFDVNEEKYEILTRDVVQKAVKNVQMESLKDFTINIIYNNLDRKDPILARNIYIYIKDQMDIARRPKLKDDTLLKLLRIALKENIKQEPLHVAFYLKIGIAEALDVMTLMEYMSKMNEEGEI